MQLDSEPEVFLSEHDTTRSCVARCVDPAADIGRHVRGLLFVGYDARTLRIVWRQRITLADSSDAMDYECLWPEYAALLRASTGYGARLVSLVED